MENKQMTSKPVEEKNDSAMEETTETVAFSNPQLTYAKGRKRHKVGMPIKVLSYTAVFVALSAITNIYSIYLGAGGSLNLALTYVPDFFAGALLGPLPGLITGLLGDLIGCWIAPKGDINFIILFSSGLMGLIPGIVFYLFRKSEIKGIKYVAAAISLVLILLICTTLNTFGLYVYYFKKTGKTFLAVMVLRLNQLPVWAINSILIILMLYPMQKIVKL